MSDIEKISYNEYNDGDFLPFSKVNEIQRCIQSHETIIEKMKRLTIPLALASLVVHLTADKIKSGEEILGITGTYTG